jgi:hypothetical protein
LTTSVTLLTMVMACVSGWTWSSGVRIIPFVEGAEGPVARRTFDVIDICEIFTHWHAGRSKSELAGSLGLSRNTVRKYVAAAEAAGMVPGARRAGDRPRRTRILPASQRSLLPRRLAERQRAVAVVKGGRVAGRKTVTPQTNYR